MIVVAVSERRREAGTLKALGAGRRHVLALVLAELRLAGVARREREARAALLLERVGLADRAGHLPGQLSGGQRQRVSIARALANKPTLILADEPTGNLDTETGRAVLDLLAGARAEGTALVMVTHNPEVGARAGTAFAIRDGLLVERTERHTA